MWYDCTLMSVLHTPHLTSDWCGIPTTLCYACTEYSRNHDAVVPVHTGSSQIPDNTPVQCHTQLACGSMSTSATKRECCVGEGLSFSVDGSCNDCTGGYIHC